MISELSPEVFRAISEHETSMRGTSGFLAAIAEARQTTSVAQTDASYTLRLKVTPASMGSEPRLVFPRLLSETEAWLSLIITSITYRLGHFTDDVVKGSDRTGPGCPIAHKRQNRYPDNS